MKPIGLSRFPASAVTRHRSLKSLPEPVPFHFHKFWNQARETAGTEFKATLYLKEPLHSIECFIDD